MKKLQQYLKKNSIPAALIKNLGEEADPTLRYLLNYDGVGALFVPQSGKPTLYVSELEYSKAKECYNNVEIFESINQIRKLLPDKVAIEFNKWTLRDKKRYPFTPVDLWDFFYIQRLIKKPQEQKLLKFACKTTSNVFQKLKSELRDFNTETEVAAWIEYQFKKKGGEAAFPTIVASGKHSAEPHHTPKSVKLKKGFTVIDCGMRYQGYNADMTRTFFKGRPTKQDKLIYSLVKNAQKAAWKIAKPKTSLSDLHQSAIVALGDESDNMIHSLGHGIGLYVHEAPFIDDYPDRFLKQGMAFTLEPGLYYKNKGGVRIEDDFIVTKNGVECLTKFSRDLQTY